MATYYCFIDFGSTFTKVCVIDPEECRIVARSQAPTTVSTDIAIGLQEALSRLTPPVALNDCAIIRACSSAAGGLRMIAIGLVPDLTAEAANRAALGAGAKVLHVFSYRLTDRELKHLEEINPDIVLLAGGTDGGDGEVIIHNARRLTQANLNCPVVVAGNKDATDEIQTILIAAGRKVYVADNVMPEIGKIAVESAREKIREVFLEHIIQAKGLDRAKTIVGEIIMPTPMAVLQAALVLAEGTRRERGVGEVIVVDVGGATTDIDSVAVGHPADPVVVLKGLPEPFAKRTVEGDLGIRVNAPTIFHLAQNMRGVSELFTKYKAEWAEARVNYLSANVNTMSNEPVEREFDVDLARAAVTIAINRHVGRIETIHTISGATPVQIGKDLTRVVTMIAAGGIFAYGPDPRYILEGTRRGPTDQLLLKPEAPQFLNDKEYILFAAGLLSELDRDVALEVMKRYLKKLDDPSPFIHCGKPPISSALTGGEWPPQTSSGDMYLEEKGVE